MKDGLLPVRAVRRDALYGRAGALLSKRPVFSFPGCTWERDLSAQLRCACVLMMNKAVVAVYDRRVSIKPKALPDL